MKINNKNLYARKTEQKGNIFQKKIEMCLIMQLTGELRSENHTYPDNPCFSAVDKRDSKNISTYDEVEPRVGAKKL